MSNNNFKINLTSNKKIDSSISDESGDLMPDMPTESTPKMQIKPSAVAANVATAKIINSAKCVFCTEDHKFSPFPVTKEIKSQQYPKELVFMRDPKTKKYVIKTVVSAKNQGWTAITPEMIKTNTVKLVDVIFWSDSIAVFESNCLMTLIVEKKNLIDKDTICNLCATIHCKKWWEDLLILIAESDFMNSSIVRAKEYLAMLRDFINSNSTISSSVRDYTFPRFNAKLRTLENIKQKEKEIKAIAALEENEIKKEQERIERLELQKQKLEKLREDNLSNEIIPELTVREVFIKMLNTNRKSHETKYLAAINPDGSLIADLTCKLGEKSTLQQGIDHETLKKKYDVWKFYKNQEKLRADPNSGIKFKKAKWISKTDSEKKDDSIIPELPIISDDPKKARELLNLNKFELQHFEAKYNEYKKIKKNGVPTNSIVLDEWQSRAIQTIRSGKSCLITGPTSGGKTYVMMDGLNSIIKSHEHENIVLVFPTFHLAYQTYANIKATFINRSIGMITSDLIHISKDANVLIGTAPELLNYLVTKGKRFQVGIFDEIHVASNVYCDQTIVSDRIRARAYTRLLSMCERQSIAASATLNNEDDMRRFMANQMNICRSQSTDTSNSTKLSYTDIELIKYGTRAVPLSEYHFDNRIISPIIRDENGIDINYSSSTEVKEITIDSYNLFQLLTQMRDRDMTPTIVFEKTDDLAWNTYSEFVSYMEQMEERDYKCYHQMITKFNSIISDFNTKFDEKMSEIPEDDNVDASRIRQGVKGNAKRDAVLRTIKSLRVGAIEQMITDGRTMLTRNIVEFNVTKPDCLCVLSKISSKKQKLLIRLMGDSYTDFITNKDFIISNVHLDMIEVIINIEEMNAEQVESLCLFQYEKGSFFKFSKNSHCTTLLKAIRDPGSNEEIWKHRKRMIILAEAQNIPAKEIDNIADVILRGLEFGIAIISNSLPFVIQNIILESLKRKDMGIVFASENMSMGINFPLRSVVIKGHKNNCSINPGKLIQMAGRCGRRGMDTQAHVIYYGIDNDFEAHHNFIAPVSYPDHFYLDITSDISGSTISNYEELALEINDIYITHYFESAEKKETKVALSCTKDGGRMKEQRKNNYDWKQKTLQSFGAKKEEENADDILEQKMIQQLAIVEQITKRSEYIMPIITKIAIISSFTELQSKELATMVCNLDEDIIYETYCIDSFKKSQDIKHLMNMMIELYNHYSACNNSKFLDFVEKIMVILRSCSNKLIRYAK